MEGNGRPFDWTRRRVRGGTTWPIRERADLDEGEREGGRTGGGAVRGSARRGESRPTTLNASRRGPAEGKAGSGGAVGGPETCGPSAGGRRERARADGELGRRPEGGEEVGGRVRGRDKGRRRGQGRKGRAANGSSARRQPSIILRSAAASSHWRALDTTLLIGFLSACLQEALVVGWLARLNPARCSLTLRPFVVTRSRRA